MTARLNPYLRFQGAAREAMEFYQRALGGELTLNTFGEFGAAGEPYADQIMHAQLETPAGLALMASDTPPGMPYDPGTNIAISLSGDDEEQLRGYWDRLQEGSTVGVPLEPQVWGATYGQCPDRFGIQWMVNIGPGS